MGQDDVEYRYEFGRNWLGFVEGALSDTRIREAQQHLLDFTGQTDLAGLTFVDVGCGSGVHSLAAHISGARRIHSFDFDADSVAATESLHVSVGRPESWTVERGSILDKTYVESLGSFDMVYAWGVLHHTGDVWRALENTLSLVSPSGVLYVALYARDVQPQPEFWLEIKQQYVRAGRLRRRYMEWWYVWTYGMSKRPSRALDTFKQMRSRNRGRGMDYFTDVRDWLGGWPMEFVWDQEAIDFCTSRGFETMRLVTGEACSEFLFRRLG